MGNVNCLIVAMIATVLVSSQSRGQDNTFVETCLGDIAKLTKPISCTSSGSTLKLGVINEAVVIQAITSSGVVTMSMLVQKIQHLPARFEDAGFIEESVRFVAQGMAGAGVSKASMRTLTIAFQCGQSDYAYIGATLGDLIPNEILAECH